MEKTSPGCCAVKRINRKPGPTPGLASGSRRAFPAGRARPRRRRSPRQPTHGPAHPSSGAPLKPYPVEYDSPFDTTAWYVEAFTPAAGGAFVWNEIEFPNGGLAVEINDGNDNGWIEVRTLGTVGLLPDGQVNRDGVGAVIRVTPEGGRTTLRPVTGGSSFASQNSLAQLFGLGRAETATVEILWPGGVVHRLHDVQAGERIVFPEIPCNPGDPSLSRRSGDTSDGED